MATVAQALRFDGELGGRLIAAAPRLLVYLLVVLIAWRSALLVANLAGPSVGPIEPVAPLPAGASRQVVDVPSILRANLFGQAASTATAENAPITSMALQLGGVVADTDEKLGFALLGSSAADIKFYRVGDLVPGGALLHAVYVDRVLLDRSGSIEALLMPPRTSISMAPPPPPVESGAAAVQSVRQLIQNDPGLINQVMRRQVVLEGDKLLGVRVYPGSNAQAFNKLGLRPGDLVTAINGTNLDEQSRAETVFSTLESAAEARVTVNRNGTTQDLVLNLAEMAAEAQRLADAPPPDPPPTDGGPPSRPESAR